MTRLTRISRHLQAHADGIEVIEHYIPPRLLQQTQPPQQTQKQLQLRRPFRDAAMVAFGAITAATLAAFVLGAGFLAFNDYMTARMNAQTKQHQRR